MNLFPNIPPLWQTFFVSMLPVLELRGALPLGLALGLPLGQAYAASVLGNMLPVPFIILFIRPLLDWLRKQSRLFARFAQWLEDRADKKGDLVIRYRLLGLVLLVAVPLPGTGAWTGALVAALLRLRLTTSIPAIFLGVLLAGVAVALLCLGVIAL